MRLQELANRQALDFGQLRGRQLSFDRKQAACHDEFLEFDENI
jgi:hypothetical protein